MFRRSLACALCICGLLLASAAAAQDEVGKGSKGPQPAAKTDAAAAEKAPPATDSGSEAAVEQPSTGNYQAQLKGLESRVDELKERIFRSKARLNLLKETVLHGVIAGSRAIITHKNEMGSSFRLIKLIYAVDGAQIYAKSDDSGALDEKREFEVFNGSIVPGNHTISVQMVFRGHGYGIFSYLKGYKFTVRSSHTITAGEGRQTGVTVRAYEKGNVTTELKDRPAVRFDVNLFASGGAVTGGGK